MTASIVMVMGGHRIKKSQGELLDVSPEGRICTKPGSFPDGRDLGKGAVGAYLNGKPTVCGGNEGGRECHEYIFDLQSWRKLPLLMLKERWEAGGIGLQNGSLIIIGGKEKENGAALSTSEILVGNDFQDGPVWPIVFWGHCVTEINQTHAFVAGGMNSEGLIRASYIFEYEKGYWTWIADLDQGRSGHVCGTISDGEDGPVIEVVAAGGQDILRVEVLSLAQKRWVQGPSLPHEMNRAVSARFGDSFAIIGGLHLGECPVEFSECFASRFIYQFSKQGHSWLLRDHAMDLPRGEHVSISIPSSNMEKLCSRSCEGCPGKKYFLFNTVDSRYNNSRYSDMFGADQNFT